MNLLCDMIPDAEDDHVSINLDFLCVIIIFNDGWNDETRDGLAWVIVAVQQ